VLIRLEEEGGNPAISAIWGMLRRKSQAGFYGLALANCSKIPLNLSILNGLTRK
jgi:hypothetical protein